METDKLTQGEVGAWLRRKGLYWSHLAKWRKLRDEGLLLSLEPKKRGTSPRTPEDKRVSELERENAHLRGKLDQAEKIIDVQKNCANSSEWRRQSRTNRANSQRS